MAGPYYVDSNVTYASTVGNNGTAKETPWGGAGGCQRAEHAVAAGETIYYKSGAEINVSLLKRFTRNGDNGTPPVVGDRVYEWSTGDVKGDAEGYVAAIDATYVWVEQTVATWGSTGKISNSAANDTNSWTYSAVTARGLVGQTAGTFALPITRKGCANDADWTPGTDVVFNTTNTIAGIESTNYARWYNIQAYGGAYGFCELGSCSYYKHCTSHDVTGYGFANPTYAEDCVAYNCGRDGFVLSGYSQTLVRPIAYGCGANYSGIAVTGDGRGVVIEDAIVFDNSGYGITINTTSGNCVRVRGSIINHNGKNGVRVMTAGRDHIVEFCRITNNGTAAGDWYGINADAAGRLVHEDYNVFYNNDKGPLLNVTAGANSINAASDAEVGYATAATNFALGSGAVLRRTSRTMADGVNVQFVTAGLAPAPIPPPAGEVVLGGTAYEGATGAVAASGTIASSIVDVAGVVTTSPGILDVDGARTAAPGILATGGVRYAEPGVLDSTGFLYPYGVMADDGVHYASGVLENHGAEYYALAATDSTPYGNGQAAQLAADVALVGAQLGNMTTAVVDLLHADNDGTLSLDNVLVAGGGNYNPAAQADHLYKIGGAYYGLTGALTNGTYYPPNDGDGVSDVTQVIIGGLFGVANAEEGTAAGGGGAALSRVRLGM